MTPQPRYVARLGLGRFFSGQWDDWFYGDGGQDQAF
jgi:hypothetical protein